MQYLGPYRNASFNSFGNTKESTDIMITFLKQIILLYAGGACSQVLIMKFPLDHFPELAEIKMKLKPQIRNEFITL